MAEIKKYQSSIEYVSQLPLPWEKLQGKRILISGATGMIGSFLIHVLMAHHTDIQIVALGRNESRAKERFNEYWNDERFTFITHDINDRLDNSKEMDFVIHAASNTHPVAYATDPIGTVTTNIIGTYNLLDYAMRCHAERFLLASSVEVYGENRGDTNYFNENYCGYINCNTLRAGYPESKRASEALCQAYKKANNLDIVIARLARTYGPTMLQGDTKAISQFIKNALNKENIVLKSEGTQMYSYSYVADSVSGLLTVLLKGENGEAYNIADKDSDIALKDLAGIISEISGTKVIFSLPDKIELAGYSKATKALMNSDKLQKLGWKAHWGMQAGLLETIESLQKGNF